MAAELEELRRRFANLRDEELLRIVTLRRAHYRQVALSLAEEELMWRGVKFAPAAGGVPAGAHGFSPHPARAQTRGTAFWLGLLLIGGACLWVAGIVDEAWSPPAGAPPYVVEFYTIVRLLLIAVISLVGGLLMKWWESVD